MSRYKLNKQCSICCKSLLDSNKTGCCNIHRDRNGVNNPFFGKHHTETTKNYLCNLSKISTSNLWKDIKYRDKVIKNSTGKKRSVEFCRRQSINTKKQFSAHPEQRIIRSVLMQKSWAKGKIVKKSCYSNKSNLEIEFFNDIKNIYPFMCQNKTIHINNKWYFPDILIERDGIIIEFFGDYWHANPYKYSKDDIINSCKVQDIWNKDYERKRGLEALGYSVFQIWQKDYKEEKDIILKDFDSYLNWESCAL